MTLGLHLPLRRLPGGEWGSIVSSHISHFAEY